MNREYNTPQLFITLMTFILLFLFITSIITTIYFDLLHPIKYYEVTTHDNQTLKVQQCNYETKICLYNNTYIDVISIKEVRK